MDGAPADTPIELERDPRVPTAGEDAAVDVPDAGGLAPMLFLSHAGADTEAARRLKVRLEAAPDARAAGLRVWFDKDDLRPGAVPWQGRFE